MVAEKALSLLFSLWPRNRPIYICNVLTHAAGDFEMTNMLQDLRPHPVLPAYYDSLEQRTAFVRSLFNSNAGEYDRINRVFSLGSGAWYRRQALRAAGLRPGMRVLDVAVGTGLVAREALGITGDRHGVIGLDLSENMIAVARRTLDIEFVQARAEAMPLADASVDFVSMGYALRHVPDLAAAFAEFARVLRPGGTILLLEIARPEGRIAHALAKFYLGQIVPVLCRWLGRGGGREMMRYYWDTIDACVAPEVILAALRQAGLADVGCDTALGMFRAYTARRVEV
jgi:demethylmenaquinone methyltransferase / 2-methoxy-6-polyprenyl-1,4-benzoquinol methylase